MPVRAEIDTSADPQSGVKLPCPECSSRIGNERRKCRMCNNFAQKVLRRSARELQRRYPDEHRAIRLEVELGLYNEMKAGFTSAAASPRRRGK